MPTFEDKKLWYGSAIDENNSAEMEARLMKNITEMEAGLIKNAPEMEPGLTKSIAEWKREFVL